MPSPFPGMDPYLETRDLWMEFHSGFVIAIRDALVPRVRPGYAVRAERYVYLCEDDEEPGALIIPEVHVIDAGHGWREYAGTAVASPPEVKCQIVSEKHPGQLFLTIRDSQMRSVVTVIEVLSPTNKDGGRGAQQYQQKRTNVCLGGANLVELDLLRGGRRFPTSEPLPAVDYCAFVTRKWQAPEASAYMWSLRDRLPTIPIPLAGDDSDVPLDLQPVLNGVYDRSGYDYILKYDHVLDPPLSGADRDWAAELVAHRQPPQWMNARPSAT